LHLDSKKQKSADKQQGTSDEKYSKDEEKLIMDLLNERYKNVTYPSSESGDDSSDVSGSIDLGETEEDYKRNKGNREKKLHQKLSSILVEYKAARASAAADAIKRMNVAAEKEAKKKPNKKIDGSTGTSASLKVCAAGGQLFSIMTS
jgi:hypothetical protein